MDMQQAPRAPPSPTSSSSSRSSRSSGGTGQLADLHATLADLRARQNHVEAMISRLQRSASPPAHGVFGTSSLRTMTTGNPISSERSTASGLRSPSPSPSPPPPTTTRSSASDEAYQARAALMRRPSMTIGALLNPVGDGSQALLSPLPSPDPNFAATRSQSDTHVTSAGQRLPADDGARMSGFPFGLARPHTHPNSLRVETVPDGSEPTGALWRDATSYSSASSASYSPPHPGTADDEEDQLMADDYLPTPAHLTGSGTTLTLIRAPCRPQAVHSTSSSSTDSASSSSSNNGSSAKAQLSPATRALLSGPPLRRPTQARGPKRHMQTAAAAPNKASKDLPFRCGHGGCTAAFARRFELDRHARTHASGPGSGVACPICGNVFRAARKDALRRHQLESIGCLRLQARLTAEELKALDCVTDDDRQRLQWQRQSNAVGGVVQQPKRVLPIAMPSPMQLPMQQQLLASLSTPS